MKVTDARGRRKHLSPGQWHVAAWQAGRWEHAASVPKEQYANARKLALVGLGAGLSAKYVLICPSGHLDIPDRVEFVDKED